MHEVLHYCLNFKNDFSNIIILFLKIETKSLKFSFEGVQIIFKSIFLL